jgi:hypothetical protein
MNTNVKKVVAIASLAIFFLIIASYAFFVSHNLIYGVKIKNVNIIDGATVHDAILHITGNAKNAINLSLDGRDISIDQAGNFDETIALLAGYNIINITAKDKFGDVDEKNYKIMYSN